MFKLGPVTLDVLKGQARIQETLDSLSILMITKTSVYEKQWFVSILWVSGGG